MTNDIESFKDYWKEVQRTALIQLEETEEHIEREEMDLTENEIIESAAEYAVDYSSFVDNSFRTIIFYTDEGFDGNGYERYVHYREFEDNRPWDMLKALSQAAFFNDVRSVLEQIFEMRDDLGDALRLIDDTLWSEGTVSNYVFDPSGRDESFTFGFECLGGNEWKMIDHLGESFEVISPDVHFEQSDDIIPERSLKLWLDNLCYRRLHEIESDE